MNVLSGDNQNAIKNTQERNMFDVAIKIGRTLALVVPLSAGPGPRPSEISASSARARLLSVGVYTQV